MHIVIHQGSQKTLLLRPSVIKEADGSITVLPFDMWLNGESYAVAMYKGEDVPLWVENGSIVVKPTLPGAFRFYRDGLFINYRDDMPEPAAQSEQPKATRNLFRKIIDLITGRQPWQ